MHTHKETLAILGCSKMALSRYVKDGKLTKTKQGRSAYYDEHEVASLVAEVADGRKRRGLEEKPKEPIPIPDEVQTAIANVSSGHVLDSIGFEYLAQATASLKELKLYDNCDKQILVLYAINAQMYYRYMYSSSMQDHMTMNASGTQTLHPHFKVMQHHEKQMLAYMDRLGFNPLSRNKFTIEKEKEIDAMEALING